MFKRIMILFVFLFSSSIIAGTCDGIQGTWKQTCSFCSTSGDYMSATCKMRNGQDKYSELVYYKRCPMVKNEDGVLTCSPCDSIPGSWQLTCSKCSTEGDYMRATCKTKKREDNFSELINYKRCSAVINEDGVLKCYW